MGFADDVEQVHREGERQTEFVVQKTALEVTKRVVKRSPVKSGKFRGNWNVGVNAPDLSVDEAARDPTGALTIAEAAVKLDQVKPGAVVYVSNALPYGDALEFGSSKQAPHRFVRITASEFKSILAQAVSDAKREKP